MRNNKRSILVLGSSLVKVQNKFRLNQNSYVSSNDFKTTPMKNNKSYGLHNCQD